MSAGPTEGTGKRAECTCGCPKRGWAARVIKSIPTAISLATHLAELLRHGGVAS